MAHEITAASLPRLHTKVLLRALRLCCIDDKQLEAWSQHAHDTNAPEPPLPKKELYVNKCVDAWSLGFEYNMGSTVTMDELKKELAKRPHVPNKQESKAIRKEKALAGRNKGRRDR